MQTTTACTLCKIPLIDDSCPKCGVWFGEECLVCHQAGYHAKGCSESEESEHKPAPYYACESL